jgi:hypothetical protein
MATTSTFHPAFNLLPQPTAQPRGGVLPGTSPGQGSPGEPSPGHVHRGTPSSWQIGQVLFTRLEIFYPAHTLAGDGPRGTKLRAGTAAGGDDTRELATRGLTQEATKASQPTVLFTRRLALSGAWLGQGKLSREQSSPGERAWGSVLWVCYRRGKDASGSHPPGEDSPRGDAHPGKAVPPGASP